MNPPHEDRGVGIEKIIAQLSSLSIEQKKLILEYLTKILKSDAENDPEKPKTRRATTSSLEELVRLYPNVDFTGFAPQDNDKEQFQLLKVVDSFEEAANTIGRDNFGKLRISLVVSGDRVTYVSDGSIALNHERFSKEELVKQLIQMYHRQG